MVGALATELVDPDVLSISNNTGVFGGMLSRESIRSPMMVPPESSSLDSTKRLEHPVRVITSIRQQYVE
jgi:hypothetical protein